MWAKLALKLFSREFRRGELTVICAAISPSVPVTNVVSGRHS